MRQLSSFGQHLFWTRNSLKTNLINCRRPRTWGAVWGLRSHMDLSALWFHLTIVISLSILTVLKIKVPNVTHTLDRHHPEDVANMRFYFCLLPSPN